jgi:hypothetical protein
MSGDRPTYLDRALEGLSETAKAEVLRVMVNLDLSPHDPTNVLLVLYGHILAAGERIPAQLAQSQRDIAAIIAELNASVDQVPEAVRSYVDATLERIREEARALGASAVEASRAHALEQFRDDLRKVAQDVNPGGVTHDRLFLRRVSPRLAAVICAVALTFVLAGSFLAGIAIGRWQTAASSVFTQAEYGRTFLALWNDPRFPPSAKQAIARWLKTH